MPLTASEISNANPAARPLKLCDGGGLFLLVALNGGKWWRLRYRFARKENQISLGVYPNVSLTEARELRDKYRMLLANGIDPSETRKGEKAAKRANEERQIAATRLMLDNDGALSFRLGNRRLTLTVAETVELRRFLDATRAVTRKVTPCP